MFRWFGIALLVTAASAQMHGGRPLSASHIAGLHHGTHRFNQGAFLGSPFFYPGYDFNEPYAVEAPPQVILTQPATINDSPKGPKPAPLLIEWRGDHYARFGGRQDSDDRASNTHPDYAEPRTTTPLLSRKTSAATLVPKAPAVLVYRDGHREEISDYAIADGMIYRQSADWQNVHSSNPIPLSNLDATATVQANQQRGVTFLLPSASNVVIASF